jgi:secreted trypsin-like serine protease
VIRALVIAAVLTACSQAPAADLGARELAVLGGSLDTTHEAVVSIATADGDPRPELCTGTIVAPKIVLTAGHCTIGREPSGLVVGVGPDSRAPTRTLPIAAIHTPSRYDYTRVADERGLDIGIIVLAEDAGIAPIPLTDAPIEGTLDLVGFGQTSGDASSRGSRNHASVTATVRCSTLLAFGDGKTNGCHGDSGGPLLGKNASGAEVVVGIVSFGSETCDPPTYAVRADAYASFVAAGADDSCTGCPPPGEDCVSSETDAGVDAPAPQPAPEPSSSGCAHAPARADGRLAMLLLVGLFIRTCNDACSRSSRARSRSARSSRSNRRS